jgi:hypothetical protein
LKQIASILLAGLLFFNWYGYRLITDLMEDTSTARMEARLDENDYDPSQLIELRVPINLPYYNDWSEFERYSGEIEIDGIHYNYVKRKIEKGELVLLCLPNNDKQMLQSARDQFFKLVNDLQHPNKGEKSLPGNTAAFKALFAEYAQEKNHWQLSAPLAETQPFNESYFAYITPAFALSPEQPPDTQA